jgi:hypothetical protein
MSPLKGKWLFPVSGAFRRVGPGRLHGETRFLLPGLVPVSQPARLADRARMHAPILCRSSCEFGKASSPVHDAGARLHC